VARVLDSPCGVVMRPYLLIYAPRSLTFAHANYKMLLSQHSPTHFYSPMSVVPKNEIAKRFKLAIFHTYPKYTLPIQMSAIYHVFSYIIPISERHF
jgi:hypothetical protein